MSNSHRSIVALLGLIALCLSGCVTPINCGNQGACGPISWGAGCGDDSCSDCSGCGELYVDPWINHPPDACDPCDVCGNYNGQSCGKCRSIFSGFETLWGYRCEPPCNQCHLASCDGGCDAIGCDSSCGGCDSCGGGDGVMEMYPPDGQIIDGQVIEMTEAPTPAPEIVEATPGDRVYTRRGDRKIFRSRARSRVATSPSDKSGF